MAKAVILAGGQGERFWPLTHEEFPKYRIRWDGKRSLLQSTFERLAQVYGKNNVYVVTTKSHVPMIREELPLLPAKRILSSLFVTTPVGRSIFPARGSGKQRARTRWFPFFRPIT